MESRDLIYWCANLGKAAGGREEIDRILLKGGNINQVKRNCGRTPLMILCWKYQGDDLLSILEMFIRYGADVKRRDNYGWNALHFVCRFNNTPQLALVIECLLQHGIDPKSTTRNKWQALHHLSRYNTSCHLLKAFQVLTHYGADIDALTNTGETPLHLLCRFNHHQPDFESTFNWFVIDVRARIDIVTCNFKTLLHTLCCYAVNLNLHRLVETLLIRYEEDQERKMINFPLETIVDTRDYFGATAILYAAKNGCIKTIQLLLPITSQNPFDQAGKGVINYLIDVVQFNLTSWCSCCRRVRINFEDVSAIFNEIRDKRKVFAEAKKIDISKMEIRISPSMELGFTNNRKDCAVNIPDPDHWAKLIDHWRSDSNLNMALVSHYLNLHSHAGVHVNKGNCSWCLRSYQVHKYVEHVIDKASEVDPRFEGELLQYGSSAERTKIFLPDEFDFMVVLKRFHESDQRPQVVVTSEACDSFRDVYGNISSARLLYYYYQLLSRILRLEHNFNFFHQDVSFGETCVTLHLYHRDEGQILKMSVDITIAVARHSTFTIDFISQRWPSIRQRRFLVADRNISVAEACRWKSSYPTIEGDIVNNIGDVALRCFSMMKLLVHISNCSNNSEQFSRKTIPSSYALKTCLFEYLRHETTPWRPGDMMKHVMGMFRSMKESPRFPFIFSFFDSSLEVCEIDSCSWGVIATIHNKLLRALKYEALGDLPLKLPETSGSSINKSNISALYSTSESTDRTTNVYLMQPPPPLPVRNSSREHDHRPNCSVDKKR